MQRSILKFSISNELDSVLAYRRAIQLSERCGLTLENQTQFATAVSEICRNVVEHAGEGNIEFGIAEEAGLLFLEAYVTDFGRGIPDVAQYLERTDRTNGHAMGLANARKLVDYIRVESTPEKGTRVKLRKRIPASHPALTKSILRNWTDEFEQETAVSPYKEFKHQNMQLLELLEELRLKNLQAENQLFEIRRLNDELVASNEAIMKLLKEREASNAKLEKQNKELDSFAHIVSHDLRAPLQNIQGLTVVLEACLEAEDIAEARKIFPMVREQAARMDRLILDILSYSLAGKHTLPRKKVELHTLLHEVLSFLNIPPGFQIHIPENMPVLLTEEIFLHQIFSNLIGNAIKHHDRSTGHIWVGCHLSGPLLYCEVADDGKGIPARDQKRIFEQFERLNEDAPADSSGLGLAIVKRICQEKGGDAWVESEGRGSRFIFTWPASEVISCA